MDTWRAAYRGIVPDTHLDGLSYDESERLWQDAIVLGDGRVFVAEDDGGVFGFASGGPRERSSRELREYEGELQTVYVLPSHKGTGAGRRLVGEVARHLAGQRVNSMLLWVFTENHPARRFYESLGESSSGRTASGSAARGSPRPRTAGRTWTRCSGTRAATRRPSN